MQDGGTRASAAAWLGLCDQHQLTRHFHACAPVLCASQHPLHLEMVLLHLPVRLWILKFPSDSFLLTVPSIWTVVAFIMLLLSYVRQNPQRPMPRGSKRAAAKSIDYVGMVVLTVGVVVLYACVSLSFIYETNQTTGLSDSKAAVTIIHGPAPGSCASWL